MCMVYLNFYFYDFISDQIFISKSLFQNDSFILARGFGSTEFIIYHVRTNNKAFVWKLILQPSQIEEKSLSAD